MTPAEQPAVWALGPMEVHVDGRTVSPGGGRAKGILAVLIERRGRTVSVDRIIDAVWGEGVGPKTKHTVQTHVSNLRKIMGRAAIVGEGGGYRLDPAEIGLDVVAAEHLAEVGAERLKMGDLDAAVNALEGGLALWRGEAFEDVTYLDAIQLEIARLMDLRIDMEEMWLRARLDREPQDVIPALRRLADAHPERESLWAALMVGLYRLGRQSEALAVYSDLRNRLVETLGIDPSPALQQLELQILEQDPELEMPDRSRRSNMPATVPGLVGRTAIEDEVVSLLTAGGSVSLVGEPGVGKSALARSVAVRLIDRCRGGVWWVDVDSLDSLELVEPTLTASIGVAGSIESTIEIMTTLGDALVVLDGVPGVPGVVADVAQHLVAGGVSVLVTSRTEQDWAHDAHMVAPLSVDETNGRSDAATLFHLRAREAVPRATDADLDDDIVRSIVASTGGNPLEIELLAAHLRTTPLSELAADTRSPWRGLIDPVDLDDEGAALVAQLAALAGGFGAGPAESLLGEAWQRILERLEAGGIVEAQHTMSSGVRYRMTDAVRGAAAVHDPAAIQAGSTALIAWAVAAQPAELRSEPVALRTALAAAIESDPASAVVIAAAAGPIWTGDRALVAEGLVWLERVVATEPDPSDALVRVHYSMAMCSLRLGNYDDATAYLARAHTATEQGFAAALRHTIVIEQGHVASLVGDRSVAARLLLEASGAEGVDAVRGRLLFAQNELWASGETSVRALEGIVDAAAAHNAGALEAHAMVTLATAHQLTGDTAVAARWANEALEIAVDSRDASIEVLALYRLGSVYRASGDPSRAWRMIRRGLRAGLEIGHRALLASMLHCAASLQLDSGDGAAAAASLGAHDSLRTTIGFVETEVDRRTHLDLVRDGLQRHDADQVDSAYSGGSHEPIRVVRSLAV